MFPNKSIVYYTDNNIDEKLRRIVAHQLVRAANGIPIISVSFKPIDLGKNIVIGQQERCDKTIFQQIVIGALEARDIVYLAEHDVLYHPSHFEFEPKENAFYYNMNRWRVRTSDGKTWFWKSNHISGRSQIVAFGSLIVEHYISFKPVRKIPFMSRCPNVDIRHGRNFTKGRRMTKLKNEVPCWGKIDLGSLTS